MSSPLLRERKALSVIDEPNTPTRNKLYEDLSTFPTRGPPFCEAESVKPVYVLSDSSLVNISLDARVDNGFSIEDSLWIGYRRNYFCVSAAFSLQDRSPDIIGCERFYTLDDDFEKVEVTSFFMRILAKSFPCGERFQLVQSDVKRRGPKTGPKLIRVIPGKLPMRELAGGHSTSRKRLNVKRLCSQKVTGLKLDDQNSILDTYPDAYAYTLAHFDRLIFPAGANCRKRTFGARSYQIVVELCGAVDEDDTAILAYVATVPIQVRLKSPSQYNSPCSKPHGQAPLQHFYSSPLKKTTTKLKSNSTVIDAKDFESKNNVKVGIIDPICHTQAEEASRYFRTVPATPWWMDLADYSAPDPLDDFGFGLHLIEADESIPRDFPPNLQIQSDFSSVRWPSIYDSCHVRSCEDNGV